MVEPIEFKVRLSVPLMPAFLSIDKGPVFKRVY